jgi:hypothetical protein
MAKKVRLVRTPEQLRAEARTISYEFVQLCESAERLRKGVFLADRITLNNTVQGFVTACRNLSCFFFPHTAHFPNLEGDDLGAVEYVPDWPARCPAPSLLLQDAKTTANKQVAHMTGERRDLNAGPGKEHLWLIDDIERELLGVVRVFLGALAGAPFDATALADLQALAPRTPVATSGMITHTGYIGVTGGPGTGPARTDVRTTAPTSGFCAKTQP